MSPRVILIGPPGSGKTTIGTRLSHALHVPLIDTDAVIEQEQSMPCGEFFTRVGEEEFRAVEERVVAQALSSSGIVSLGGGAVLSAATRELLADHTVVYLQVSAEEGVRRTSGSSARPLLNVPDPEGTYRKLLDERSALYEECASYSIHSDGKDPHRVVTDILQFIEDVEAERNERRP